MKKTPRTIPAYVRKVMNERQKSEKRKKKLYTDRWDSIRRQVYQRDGYRCVLCGKKTKLHAHHVVPVQVSHDNSLSNLISVCSRCHRTLESIGYKILESGGHKEDVRRVEFKMIAEAQLKLRRKDNSGDNNDTRGNNPEPDQVIAENEQETARSGGENQLSS